MKRYLLGITSFNESEKIKRVVEKFNDYGRYDVLIVDDGSNDRSIERLPRHPSIAIIRNVTTKGAGYSTRQVIDYAKEKGYLAMIFVAGNDKDSPADVDKLIWAIEEGYDFVQGSRYLKEGRYGQMPFYRVIATRFLHPILFSLKKSLYDSGAEFALMTGSGSAFYGIYLTEEKAIAAREKLLTEYPGSQVYLSMN